LVIGPPGSAAWLRRRGLRRATELPVGTPVTVGDVELTPVEAEHDGRRSAFVGPRAEAVGWVLRGPAGRRVYFAGDTDLHPVMDELADVSLALLPVWGWGPNLGPGHLDPERAAEAVARIRPALAVPIHWGTFFPLHLHRWPPLSRLLHEPPRHFAEHVRGRGLDARVVIPEPGLAIDVPPPPPPR
jgi:L-ascorbate metabolism protein UlaG (beta-lactamase superfamily)